MSRHSVHTAPEKLIFGTRVVAIGAGRFNSFAVDEAGVLWAWGLNIDGQTGTGSTESVVETPGKVTGMSKTELGGATVISMQGGAHHSLFLSSDGHVFTCGHSDAGQIGIPKDDLTTGQVCEPIPITHPDSNVDPIVSISCGA
jgi:regulator of chromosome condensation